MHQVTAARYIDGHKIWFEFDHKHQGIIDLTTTICHDHRTIFRELSDIEKFKRFRLDADTIVWENGLDLAPDYLYGKLSQSANTA